MVLAHGQYRCAGGANVAQRLAGTKAKKSSSRAVSFRIVFGRLCAADQARYSARIAAWSGPAAGAAGPAGTTTAGATGTGAGTGASGRV